MKTVTLSTVGLRRKLLACVAVGALTGGSISPAFAAGNDGNTTSPIKHVIIIIGENRSFDHVFATYTPVNPNATVLNLLSEGIVNADGSPGPNYGAALQYSANDFGTYKLTPPKAPYSTLPPALVGGTWTPYVCQFLGYAQDSVTSCVSKENIETAQVLREWLGRWLLPISPDRRDGTNEQDAGHARKLRRAGCKPPPAWPLSADE